MTKRIIAIVSICILFLSCLCFSVSAVENTSHPRIQFYDFFYYGYGREVPTLQETPNGWEFVTNNAVALVNNFDFETKIKALDYSSNDFVKLTFKMQLYAYTTSGHAYALTPFSVSFSDSNGVSLHWEPDSTPTWLYFDSGKIKTEYFTVHIKAQLPAGVTHLVLDFNAFDFTVSDGSEKYAPPSLPSDIVEEQEKEQRVIDEISDSAAEAESTIMSETGTSLGTFAKGLAVATNLVQRLYEHNAFLHPLLYFSLGCSIIALLLGVFRGIISRRGDK